MRTISGCCRIWVGPVEANAIALQIENVTPPRPMTHDLLKNLLTEFDARVQRVVITALRGNTFYAYLDIDRQGTRILVDARPSDALAIALRSRAPVFVEDSVLNQASSVEVSNEEADRERLQRWLESLDPRRHGLQNVAKFAVFLTGLRGLPRMAGTRPPGST
jgi:bifunctional DNase/RNase